MASMFPAPLPTKVRADRSRRAEIRVYDSLAASSVPDIRAFHSVAWLSRDGRGEARDGEADFVVIHRRFGLLILEVKGGGIARDGPSGKWWSTDVDGAAHEIEDPFDQASRSKYALLKKIREIPAFHDRWISIVHAVVFPDVARVGVSLGLHAPPEIVISGGDLPLIVQRIEEIYRWSGAEMPLSEGDCKELERLLAPSFVMRAPAAVAARHADAQIVTLTEEQFSVLDLLSRARRVAISGPAGSGKSLLAMEQARRLAGQGFRTLFVCFNQPLAAKVAESLHGEPLLEVHTFHDFCRSMAVRAGLMPSGYTDPNPTEFFAGLPGQLLESLERRADLRFDAIIVDEGQGFDTEWWALLELALADAKHGVLYVFHDDSQQVRADPQAIPEGLTEIHLSKNLRNTRQIHTLAQRFSADSDAQAVGPEGRPVAFAEVASGEALAGVLARVVDGLTREHGFRAEEITVLTGRGRDRTALAGVERIGVHRCALPPTLTGVIGLDTIRRFQGLDSRVVILCELESVLDSPGLLYVGITRARVHLVVVGEVQTLTRLQQANA